MIFLLKLEPVFICSYYHNQNDTNVIADELAIRADGADDGTRTDETLPLILSYFIEIFRI